MKILVIGAGIMGSQIGCEYALGGHDVAFVTRSKRRAVARVKHAFSVVEREELADAAAVAEAQTRIDFDGELRSPCDIALEALPEDFALKCAILKEVAEHAPEAVLATNTSSLSVTALGTAIGSSERTIGTHYWNPPLLMPLVEVVAGDEVSRRVLDFMCEALMALGKSPVVIRRDVPGFVWNRLQVAILREAMWLVENAVASPADVDKIVREGLARRWRYIGPFETVALGGVSTWREVSSNLLPELSRVTNLEHLEEWADVQAGDLDRLRDHRDAGLGAELRGEKEGSR